MTTARTALPFARTLTVATAAFAGCIRILAETSHEHGEEFAGFENGWMERWIDMDGNFGEDFVPEGDVLLPVTEDMILKPKIPRVPLHLIEEAYASKIVSLYLEQIVLPGICEMDEFDRAFIAFAMECDIDAVRVSEGEVHSLQTLEMPALSRDGSIDDKVWGPSLLLEPSGDIYDDELSPATVDSGDPITFDLADEEVAA